MSCISKNSVGDRGRKAVSARGKLGKGKECSGAGAFFVYSGRRMQTDCEGP